MDPYMFESSLGMHIHKLDASVRNDEDFAIFKKKITRIFLMRTADLAYTHGLG